MENAIPKLSIVVHTKNLIQVVSDCDPSYEAYNGKCYSEIEHCCAYKESDSSCTDCDATYEAYNGKCYL